MAVSYVSEVGSPSSMNEGTRPQRNLLVDFVRGLALFVIFIDHNFFGWLEKCTPHQYSFSDAAEVFFLLSGYASALAYGRVLRAKGFKACMNKAVGRGLQLYLAEVCLFGMILLTIAFALHYHLELPETLTHLFHDKPLEAAKDAVTLKGVLPLLGLGLLPVYILFIALTPLALLAVSRRFWLVAALSGGAYLTTQILPHLWTGADFPPATWYFNPFAWQVVFFGGLMIGYVQLQSPERVWRPERKWIAAAVCGLAVIAFVRIAPSNTVFDLLHNSTLRNIIPRPFPFTEKHNLEPLRLVNLAFWIILMASISAENGFFRKRLAWIPILCGQNSLAVYCTGVLLNYAGIIYLSIAGRGKIHELAFTLVGCCAMVGVAFIWSRAKHTMLTAKRREQIAPSACSVSSAA